MYDAQTGMRLDNTQPMERVETKHVPAVPTAHHLHQRTARTQTLNSAHVKAPAAPLEAKNKKPTHHIQPRPKVTISAYINTANTTHHPPGTPPPHTTLVPQP